MFPIRDHNPSGRRPLVTYALIFANILVFLSYWLTTTDQNHLGWLFFNWGLVPARTMSGVAPLTWITHMFLHGGWMHLAGNMLFLWIFGDNLEDEMGHAGFAVFYLVAGLAAAVLQIASDPISADPMVGASGAIAGVLGGYLLLYPRAQVDVLVIFVIFFRIFTFPAWLVLGVWFGFQLLSGSIGMGDGVAYMAHVGGFIAGVVLTLPVLLLRGGRAFWARNQGQPPHPAAEYKFSKTSIPLVRRR